MDENKMKDAKVDNAKVDTKKVEEKTETKESETAKVEVKEEVKAETKTEKKEAKDDKVVTKDVAVANAYSLRISAKYSVYICKIIKHKTPDAAVKRLEEAAAGKRAIPMSGREVPHQKGKGLSGGKFPKNACNGIIEVIKQVKANAANAGIDNPVITIAQANKASMPFRSGGRRGKRTHIHLEVKDKSKLMESKRK